MRTAVHEPGRRPSRPRRRTGRHLTGDVPPPGPGATSVLQCPGLRCSVREPAQTATCTHLRVITHAHGHTHTHARACARACAHTRAHTTARPLCLWEASDAGDGGDGDDVKREIALRSGASVHLPPGGKAARGAVSGTPGLGNPVYVSFLRSRELQFKRLC